MRVLFKRYALTTQYKDVRRLRVNILMIRCHIALGGLTPGKRGCSVQDTGLIIHISTGCARTVQIVTYNVLPLWQNFTYQHILFYAYLGYIKEIGRSFFVTMYKRCKEEYHFNCKTFTNCRTIHNGLHQLVVAPFNLQTPIITQCIPTTLLNGLRNS